MAGKLSTIQYDTIGETPMPLTAGTTLGPYKIVSLLGEGGMGAVYKAHDPRLGRFVAIKVAKEQFSERFDREARAVAALNHNNICTLYDVGPHYLVMEFVEGPMLSTRIHQGAMTLDDALPLLRQLVDAIEAAHDKNIYHRDLKPDNIKITPQGVVKVLDFGLAKAADPPPPPIDPENATTLKLPTKAGVIMGTPAYMSPEQAAGKPVDKRADIWAFAVIALEMFSGKPVFDGESVAHILAEVISKELDVDAAPPELRPLLTRCLVRDANLRMRDIGEARIALRDPLAQPTLLAKVQRRWLAPALAITALTLLAMGGAWWLSTRPVEKPLIQMIADLGSAPAAAGSGIAISRDGTRIALVGSSGGKNIIFYRRLSDEKGVALHGTEGATHPFFSPDGQWIGFFADRRLKRIPSAGGSAMALCDAPAGRGGSWGTDGFIVATLDSAGGIMKIPEGGGTPVTLIERRPEERSLRFPSLLPGGKGILFMVGRDSAHYDASTLEVFSTATRQRKVIREGGRYPRYLASGHIAYHLNDTLFAFPFRLDKLEAEGASVPLLGDVSFGGPGNAFMDVSENGTLVFVRGFSPQIRQKNLLHWVDGKNAPQPLTSEAGGYQPLISPDGTRLVYLASESGPYTAWLKDLHRETTTQLTRVATYGIVWTPDSKHLVYGLDEGGLYWMRSDGGGKPQLLLATPGKMLVHPTSISPDGRKLIYTANLPAAGNFLLPLEPGNDGDIAPKAGKPEPFLDQAGMTPREATFSPDGKWVAFHTSDANGHVYVRPVPDTGGKWQVSGGEGGKSAEWSPNGRELFYIGLDGRIRVVAYTAQGTTFQLGQPRVWAEAMLPLFRATLSASPDGKRIATVIYPPTNDADVKTMVLFNFFDEVKRRIRYNR